MRTLLLAALITLPFGAIGCKPARVVYQRVEIPVPVPCQEPPLLVWPELPIYKLGPSPAPADIARAYATSVQILQGQLWMAYTVLDGYRKTTPPAAPKQPEGVR